LQGGKWKAKDSKSQSKLERQIEWSTDSEHFRAIEKTMRRMAKSETLRGRDFGAAESEMPAIGTSENNKGRNRPRGIFPLI
jgi:hypothetical protein